MFYWFLKWIALGPVLRAVFRPVTEGEDNVPEEGPAILASNHLSYADWLFMPLTLTRRVTFVAKAEYFTTPGIKGWFQKKFFSGPARCRSTAPAVRPPRAPSRARRSCSPKVNCSASTPKARALTTVGSIGAGRGSPGWRWKPECR